MLNVLIYIVGAIVFAFLVYQTFGFVKDLRASYRRGYTKVAVTFTIALVAVWVLYIGAMTYLIT